MRTAVTLFIAALALAGCPKAPPAPGPIPQGKPFTPVPAPVPAPTPDGLQREFTLGMPRQGWVLRFRWPDGVRVTADRLEQGGTVRRLMSVGDRGRLTLSVVIAQAPEGVATLRELRDSEWERLRLGNRFIVEEVETFQTETVMGGTYRVPTLRGIPTNRRDYHGWLLRDGVAVHAWITKSHTSPADAERFRTWARSMHLAEEPARPADRLLFARAALAQGGAEAVDRALPHLDAVLAGWAGLSPPQKLQVLAVAGSAYLAKDRAPELLALADRRLHEDPACAEAHYARALALAWLDRNDDAVAALEAAFAVLGAAARLPDPTEDSAFILLGDHPKFEALVARRAVQLSAQDK